MVRVNTSIILKKIENLEEIIKHIEKFLDFKDLNARNVIDDQTMGFIGGIEDLKNNLKNNRLKKEELLNLKKQIKDIELFLLTKFYHYV
ncbi:MAG: hypothetical protein GF329_15005 [Candidatus Lokiarchaeota archaeon]|nr:hypothetical protein [Candidatus Lokiarchaeota archaeon]